MNEGNLFPAETQGVSQDGMLVIEQFLMANYRFRRNILNGKVEFAELPKADNKAEGNTVEDVDSLSLASENEAELEYRALTTPALNTIIIKAKREQVMEKGSPKTEITEYVSSEEVPEYNPVQQFLNNLPTWDGQNHIAKVFGRLPGITSEQLNYLTIWLRSAVAHWLQMDMLHGNECVPTFIGAQGCGKTTFVRRLLPRPSEPLEQVRQGDGADQQPLRQPRRARRHTAQPAVVAEADAVGQQGEQSSHLRTNTGGPTPIRIVRGHHQQPPSAEGCHRHAPIHLHPDS